MSKALILVPRPAPHLPATQEYLQARGLTIIPLALSTPQSTHIPYPANATALLLTSQLAVQPGLPNLPAYCVGEQTAHAARNAGLNVAYAGQGNAHGLGQGVAAQNLPPQTFLHPHGSQANLEWHSLLTAAGHQVLAVEAYRPQPLATLPQHVAATLHTTPPTHTFLFSAGSANHLANLLKQANMAPTGTAVAFSEAVAKVARQHWPQVRVATRPTLAAMVQALRNQENNKALK